MSQIKENIEKSQDCRKAHADKSRKPNLNYKPDDLVWVKLRPLSKANQSKSANSMPRKYGPDIILSQKSSSSFVIANCDKPDEPLGVYYASAVTPFQNARQNQFPVMPFRKRGRPPKEPPNANKNSMKTPKISKIPSLCRDGQAV
ncbi:hypothetical protein HNY73_022011 [Argiope bruennichi]|uniref:Uncharacterized protein n=1 Tax=Argiope bruennichi TaxID=94029 RepID=A0A8T0E0J2_ARGBR|nr:hypothetical protein HNY73_022011 [Argiope bruennichi]